MLISLLVVGTISQSATTAVPGTSPCRLWCQLPCLYPWQPVQYYCCDIYGKIIFRVHELRTGLGVLRNRYFTRGTKKNLFITRTFL